MNTIRKFTLSSIISLLFFIGLNAQEYTPSANTLSYKTDVFGSAATGDYTPFWMTSNRYGKVPLESGNFLLEAGVFQQQYFGKGFRWEAGLDLIVAAPRYRNVYIQQLYAEIGYKSLLLSIGSKEKYTSLWDKRLSTGDMTFSNNARPIPEINISIPEFTPFPWTKGWLHVKGDFAVGHSFDNTYLEKFTDNKYTYVKDVLWHHKSFYLRIKDTHNKFPLSLDFGFQHWAQWGGTSTKEDTGKQPRSLKDFVRIVFGKEGGDGATNNDVLNVLGNHYGSYDFKLSYTEEKWAAHAYHQRFFDDKSGMEFKNGWDGLWGFQFDLNFFPWVKKVVLEHVNTRDQSGPFHFINFDHDAHPGRGGGNDNYYNNGDYTSGVSYFNRSLGSPLLPSPEYNENGALGFKNNRVKDWHYGMEGSLSSYVDYRLLFTIMNGWGTNGYPYLKKKSGTSCLVDILYRHPALPEWQFTGTIAGDTGDMFDKGIGFSLGIRKSGVLKKW